MEGELVLGTVTLCTDENSHSLLCWLSVPVCLLL